MHAELLLNLEAEQFGALPNLISTWGPFQSCGEIAEIEHQSNLIC
jgi:hypothetical protein